jgi:hypothetical protein
MKRGQSGGGKAFKKKQQQFNSEELPSEMQASNDERIARFATVKSMNRYEEVTESKYIDFFHKKTLFFFNIL